MTGTCATCRHWHRGERPYIGERLAVCDPETYEPVDPQPFEVHQCNSPRVRFYERPEQNGAAVVDGSEYFAALMTGPDFGCNAYDEAPDADA